jgi:hypothetical protein
MLHFTRCVRDAPLLLRFQAAGTIAAIGGRSERIVPVPEVRN